MAKERHLLSIFINNRRGILSEVTSVFRDHDFDIESLTTSKVTKDASIHRITISITGKHEKIETLCKELEENKDVLQTINLDIGDAVLERELALVKITTDMKGANEVMDLAVKHMAEIIYAQRNVMIFKISDTEVKVSAFLDAVEGVCDSEILRSGVVAASLTEDIISYKKK